MDILLTIITPIVVAIGLGVAFALSKKERKRKNEKLNRRDFVIRSSYSWGVIMSTIEVLILCLLVFGNIESPFPVGVNVALGIFGAAFGVGILQAFRERVRVVEKSEITYTPIFGKKRVYSFSDIESVEKKRTGVYVFIKGKKAFNLDPSGIGTSLFLELYREI